MTDTTQDYPYDRVTGELLTPLKSSPVPENKVIELTFPEALKEVLNGKMIMRLSWPPTGDFVQMKDEFLTVYTGRKFHRLLVSLGDMEAIDWVVVGEKIE